MDPVSVHPVLEADLRVSRAPVAELGAAAVRARQDAGLMGEPAEYLVVCVPPGKAMIARAAVAKAALEAIAG